MTYNLRANLKKRLADKGLSVHALEKRAGLRQSTVQNIMQGRSKHPRIDILQAIADQLDCTLEDLIGKGTSLPIGKDESSEPIISSSWNQDLFFETVYIIKKILAEKTKTVNKDFVFHCIEEIYAYSLNGNPPALDHRFAEWFIEQGLKSMGE